MAHETIGGDLIFLVKEIYQQLMVNCDVARTVFHNCIPNLDPADLQRLESNLGQKMGEKK